MVRITLIDPVDMSKPMFGDGCSTVVASAIRVLGKRLILVGVSSNEDCHPVGSWCETSIFGQTCDFFPVISADKLGRKYVKTLAFTLALSRYWRIIREKSSGNVISQNYMVMWWLSYMNDIACRMFYFPGLANPLLIGRKPLLGRMLYRAYEKINLTRLVKMDLVLAAASAKEISGFVKDSRRYIDDIEIFQLPTSVDVSFFSPVLDATRLKDKYGVEKGVVHFTCVGRLARVKGIDFLIDALKVFNKRFMPARLLVVGDGEEGEALRRYAELAGLAEDVVFFGNVPPDKVRDIINCSDVCLVGSHHEGFSCAMVEQISCGKPLVSTDVSGASEIIEDGSNGFIVKDRDPNIFAEYVYKAHNLPGAGKRSREIALDKYSEQAVWNRFLHLMEDAVE